MKSQQVHEPTFAVDLSPTELHVLSDALDVWLRDADAHVLDEDEQAERAVAGELWTTLTGDPAR